TSNALGTGADPSQIVVGVHAGRMPIAPVELDRVLADGHDREGMDAGVLGWSGLQADGARAALPEICRRIDGIVPVTPADANIPFVGTRDLERYRHSRRTHGVVPGRRPSCPLAHSPACTDVSAVGPSKRLTRMAGRPSRVTATRCRIEIVPSVGLYLSRSCAPPASPPEASAMLAPARALYWSTHACSTSIASFRPDSAMPLLLLDLEAIEDHVRPSRFEQPDPRLSGDVAIDDLREVRRQPGGVVAPPRVAPTARVVDGAAVDHAQ